MAETTEDSHSRIPKELVFQDVLDQVQVLQENPVERASTNPGSPGCGRLWPLAAEGCAAPLDPHVLLRHPVRHHRLHEHAGVSGKSNKVISSPCFPAQGASLQGHLEGHLRLL